MPRFETGLLEPVFQHIDALLLPRKQTLQVPQLIRGVPTIPNGLGANDAPGAMLPNGHVLFAVSTTPGFAGPTSRR